EQLLATAETALSRSQDEWDTQQRQESRQRAEHQARLQQQQTRHAQQQQLAEIELQKQRDALSSRAEHLERRAAALDQMRNDLLRVQRETLEMRLATEELWTQMSSLVPSAALTQSLAALRAKVAETFQLQSAEIAAQRAEAEQLAANIGAQFQQFAAQK